MSHQSERAQKAAATRARNLALQDQADQTLIESTRAPRNAKVKALEEASWNPLVPRQKRAASPTQDQIREKKSRKTSEPAKKKKSARIEISGSARKKTKTPTKSRDVSVSSTPAIASTPQNRDGVPKAFDIHVSNSPAVAATPTGRSRSHAPKAATINDTSDEGEVIPRHIKERSKATAVANRHHPTTYEDSSDARSLTDSDNDDKCQTSDGTDSDGASLLHANAKALSEIFDAEMPTIIDSTRPEQRKRKSTHHNQASNANEDENDADAASLPQSDQPEYSSTSDEHTESTSEDEIPQVKSKTARKPTGHRAKAFALEEPHISKTLPKKLSKMHKSTTTSEPQWPKHATLVWPTSGGDLKLTDQHVLIADVVRTGIANITAHVLLKHSFPEVDQKLQYRRSIIQEAARERKRDVAHIKDIYIRLKEDSEFCDALGELVMDRIASLRKPIKLGAVTQIAAYELGIGDKCVNRVAALFDQEAFIFRGSWSTHPKSGKPVWSCQASQPFLNEAIVGILHYAFFQQRSSVGFQMINKRPSAFKSCFDKCSKPELPAAMAALGGTGAYAAILDWQTGVYVQSKFGANVLASIYKRLLDTLETLKAQSIPFYHHIMSTLYELVVGPPTADIKQSGALQLIDFSEFN